jgi:hypothetical protein
MLMVNTRSEIVNKKYWEVFMVEPCILRSIDCLLPTNALNVNFI